MTFNPAFDVSLNVGEHWYWNLGLGLVHGQVLVMSWLVFIVMGGIGLVGNRNLATVPVGTQNLTEFLGEYLRDLTKSQLGEHHYKQWVPFVGTFFLFILGSNWLGGLLPWKIIELPEGELAAPTNDINTTFGLAFLVSISYFYAGLKEKGLGYFKRYVSPAVFLLPINILEDFSKPLSLSFRLFGNILGDEIVVAVLVSLVPILIPVPVMLLGTFTAGVQALVFATLAGAYVEEALADH